MDSLSHACFSYLTCRSTGTAPTARVGLVAAAVALLPDLDFLLMPLLTDLPRFAFHRGPSHSLFIALFVGLLLGGLLFRYLGMSWPRATLLVAVSWCSHIILDMCTGFGVALFWPFSHARASADLLFVVDPLATLPLLFASLWDLRKNWSAAAKRRRIALSGLILWGAYAAVSFGIRSHITEAYRNELKMEGYQVQAIHAEPTPFNNQLWYLCAKTEDSFLITYRSLWDGENWERSTELPLHQTPLAEFAKQHPLPLKMKVILKDWFTSRTPQEGKLEVIDLRLGMRYGWEDDDAPFLFVYRLWLTDSKLLHWSMNKPQSRYDYGRLQNLFARIRGNIPKHRLQTKPTPKLSEQGASISQSKLTERKL